MICHAWHVPNSYCTLYISTSVQWRIYPLAKSAMAPPLANKFFFTIGKIGKKMAPVA